MKWNHDGYVIGDIVTIREDLVENNEYDDVFFNDLMNKYRGRSYTIEKIISPRRYLISDREGWTWTDVMFK